MKFYYLVIVIMNLFILYSFNFVSKKINLFDKPDSNRKIHLTPIANIGGLIIFINFIFFSLFSNIQHEILVTFSNQILIFCFMFLCVGVFDDKKNLNANFKLIIFLTLTTILLIFNDNFFITNLKFSFYEKELSLHSYSFSFIFSVICFLAFINAVNMFDGINLQCGLYFLFVSTIFLSKGLYTDLYSTLIIGLIFFIYLNKKNLCFLGNNGTYFISFLFSCSFIYSYNSSNSFFVDEIFLIMIIPGLEMIRLTISRIVNKKHPFKADKNHLHHYLLNKYNLNKAVMISFIMFTSPYLFYLIIPDYSLLIISVSTLIYFYIIIKLKKLVNFEVQ